MLRDLGRLGRADASNKGAGFGWVGRSAAGAEAGVVEGGEEPAAAAGVADAPGVGEGAGWRDMVSRITFLEGGTHFMS